MEKTIFEIIIEEAMNMEQGKVLKISSLTKKGCHNFMSYLERFKRKYAYECDCPEARRLVIDKRQTKDKMYEIILTKVKPLDVCVINDDGTLKKLDLIE